MIAFPSFTVKSSMMLFGLGQFIPDSYHLWQMVIKTLLLFDNVSFDLLKIVEVYFGKDGRDFILLMQVY